MNHQNDSKMHFTIQIRGDGSLTIPDFAVRGLGYRPGDTAELAIPLDPCLCRCGENELNLSRGCADADESCYATDSDHLKIPCALLEEACISNDRDITVLAADGALVIVATDEELEELPTELCALLNELGISPLTVHKLSEDTRHE